MTDINIFIDGKPVKAGEGERILWAALDAGIYIPHLCSMREADSPLASCRLCFVEIEGYADPVASCAVCVEEGMKITTRSARVDRLVRTSFDLLMSVHRLDCKECPANKKCPLQDIAKAKKFPLKQKRFRKIEPDLPVDDSHPEFGLNPNHCVLCGRCIWVCNEKVRCGIIDFARRGLDMTVSTFDGQPLAEHAECEGCLKCVEACPVGALYMKNDKKDE